MKSQESDPVVAFLASSVAAGAEAAQIADLIVTACEGIDLALTPIVGSKGVAALFKRSLHLTARTHPWMAGRDTADAQAAIDLTVFKALLQRQTAADTATGGGLFLQTFHELLTGLVGRSLTERLLRSVWLTLLSGSPAQDIS